MLERGRCPWVSPWRRRTEEERDARSTSHLGEAAVRPPVRHQRHAAGGRGAGAADHLHGRDAADAPGADAPASVTGARRRRVFEGAAAGAGASDGGGGAAPGGGGGERGG